MIVLDVKYLSEVFTAKLSFQICDESLVRVNLRAEGDRKADNGKIASEVWIKQVNSIFIRERTTHGVHLLAFLTSMALRLVTKS